MRASRVRVSAFEVPTTSPEADGTLGWDHTTLVTVEVHVDDVVGLGLTYADAATSHFVVEHLAGIALDSDASNPPAIFDRMGTAVRNLGRDGVAATAIAAVDMALWDADAKRRGWSMVDHPGAVREGVEAYASGGFTSYSLEELRAHVAAYADQGFRRAKIKIADDGHALDRVVAAREGLGPRPELFVDANGAFTPKHALRLARQMDPFGVRWFEEPCSSDDLEGLRFVREHGPASMDVAAGEYGYRARALQRMLDAGAVDVLQADATRCGVTGFLRVADDCQARGVPLSAHCAPTIHAHLGCARRAVVHVEHFHDHARIEERLLEGALVPQEGVLRPHVDRPGWGIELRRADAARFVVFDEDLPARASR